MSKKPVNYRLTELAVQLLKEMAEKKGVSQAAILEMIIREAAAKQS
ncbi:hypothetical protein GCM10023183_09030 [Nibribacter koreensis]|uniref:Ribbon-helix-helix protein, copG family n=1 Tax=Nibribacter koreensis TaxID=1084519 RepID=A0ABP8FB76_9BACT